MMDSYKIFRLFLFMLVFCNVTLALDGCGFRLRGSLGSAKALPAVYLQGTPGSAIMVELNETLYSMGTAIASDKALSQYVLNILNEQQDRRILSVSSAGQVQEYELHYAVMFEVTDSQGNNLLSSQSISLVRSFSFTETAVLAKGSEEETLIDGMRREAVQGIIRRMQAIKPAVNQPGN